MVFDKESKRLVIYFFYDKEGIVDRYVDYMINAISPFSDRLVIVCNGKLTEEGRAVFEQYTNEIIVRENRGFDVWAYKTALETVGLDNLKEYSEVIMMNFTIMGPLYPFEEMFRTMDEKDLDFWGLTLFHGAEFDPFGKIKYGYLPLHIQSHFIAVRRDMLASEAFIKYWKEMPMITSYEEAIGWHEAIFTKTFEDLGYTWDAYVDTRDEMDKCYCPIIMSPAALIRERRCPVFKRRSFFHEYEDILQFTTGEPAAELFQYIREETDYDEDLILENMLRLQNQADIKRNLHLTYILPCRSEKNSALSFENQRIALVIHAYFEDLIEYCYAYALSMPEVSDIYITTDTPQKKENIEKVFHKGPWNRVQVILIENRGRDVSALLVGTKEFIHNYDYVCFVHDKKVAQLDASIKGASFSYKCFENLLKSRDFVKNVLATFEENPKLGMLVPPPPNFAEYYPTLGAVDWGENYDNTVALARKLGIHVNFDPQKEPVAPLGTMFWFRPEALKPLFAHDWTYEEFPKEPNKTDGTLLHAVERVYPFAVQEAGYYPAWLMNDSFASIEVDNLYFMLREINKAVFELVGPNIHYNVVQNIKYLAKEGRTGIRKYGQLFLDTGKGFHEEDSETVVLEGTNSYYEYDGLDKYGTVSRLRWDPGECGGIEVKIPNIEIYLENGEVLYRGIDDIQSNGIRISDAILFLARDPQIYVELPKEMTIRKVVIMAFVEKDITTEKAEELKARLSTRKKIGKKIKNIFGI